MVDCYSNRSGSLFNSPYGPVRVKIGCANGGSTGSSRFAFARVDGKSSVTVCGNAIPSRRPITDIDTSTAAVPFATRKRCRLRNNRTRVGGIANKQRNTIVALLNMTSNITPAVTRNNRFLLHNKRAFATDPNDRVALRTFRSNSNAYA